MKQFNGVAQVGIVDLNEFVGRGRLGRAVEPALHQAADAIHATRPLLHCRRRPRDSIVHYAPAEGVQVFALLKHVRGHEHQRKAGHAELAHQTLIDTSGHPAHRYLFLEGDSIEPGELG